MPLDVKMLPTKIVMLIFTLILIALCYPLYLLIKKLLDKQCQLLNKNEALINVFPGLYIKNDIINNLFNIQIGEKITIKNLFDNLFNEVQKAIENDFFFKGIVTKKLIDINNLDILVGTYHKYCIAFLKNQELFENTSLLSPEQAELFIKKFEAFNKFQGHCKDIQQTSIYAILVSVGMIICISIAIFSAFRLAFCGPDSCLKLCCNNQERNIGT